MHKQRLIFWIKDASYMKLDSHNITSLKACLKDYFLQNSNLKHCTCKSCEYSHLYIAVVQMTWIVFSPFCVCTDIVYIYNILAGKTSYIQLLRASNSPRSNKTLRALVITECARVLLYQSFLTYQGMIPLSFLAWQRLIFVWRGGYYSIRLQILADSLNS